MQSYSSFISKLFNVLIHILFFTILLFIHLSTIHPSHPPSLLCNPTLHLSLNYSSFSSTFTFHNPTLHSSLSDIHPFHPTSLLHNPTLHSSHNYSSFSSTFTSSPSILHSSLNYPFFYPPSYIYHLTLNSSLNYLSFSSTFTSSPSILYSSLNYSSFSSTFTSLPSILYSSLNYSCFSFTFTSSKSYSSFISQLFILLIHLHFFTILLFIHLSTIHPSHPSSLLYHPSFIHLSHLFILLPLTHLSIPIEFSFIFFKV